MASQDQMKVTIASVDASKAGSSAPESVDESLEQPSHGMTLADTSRDPNINRDGGVGTDMNTQDVAEQDDGEIVYENDHNQSQQQKEEQDNREQDESAGAGDSKHQIGDATVGKIETIQDKKNELEENNSKGSGSKQLREAGTSGSDRGSGNNNRDVKNGSDAKTKDVENTSQNDSVNNNESGGSDPNLQEEKVNSPASLHNHNHNTKKKVGWLVVGSTGVGKSSFVNLFADGKKALVSGDAKSCTKALGCYESKCKDGSDQNFLLIDTIGYEDSDGLTNEEISMETVRFIHKQQIDSIIIFWIMNGEARATSTLQKQAQFINSFRKTDIWNSCVIIVKEATPTRLSEKSQGARKAIEMIVNNDIKSDNIIECGYKCIDWLKGMSLEDVEDLTPEQKKKRNIFNEDGVRELILEKSSLVNYCQVIFENHKCIKCGLKGDPRCLSPYCHFGTKPKKIHPELDKYKHKDNKLYYKHRESIKEQYKHKSDTFREEYEHSGELKQKVKEDVKDYHDGKLELCHEGPIIKRHTGKIVGRHNKDGKFEKYHDRHAKPYHPGVAVTCHPGELVRDHSDRYVPAQHRGELEKYHPKTRNLFFGNDWACCTEDKNSAGCTYRWSRCKCDKKDPACVAGKWRCCDKTDENDPKCGKPSKWSCCGGLSGDQTCAMKMNCCDVDVVENISTKRKEPRTQGCKLRYLCCFHEHSHAGCKEKWSCCGDLNKDGKGCIHEWKCCGREVNVTTNKGNGNGAGKNINYDNSNGCESTCSKCGQSAKSSNNGCVKQYSCCFGKPGSKGCKTKKVEIEGKIKWTCCGQEPGSDRGCIKKVYHSCCNTLKGSDGCEIYYPCCDTFKFQNIISRDGCIEYYKCCGSDSKTGHLKDGCVLKCCGVSRLGDNSKNGCLEICRQCEGKWNDEKVKGCSIGKDYQHETQEISI